MNVNGGFIQGLWMLYAPSPCPTALSPGVRTRVSEEEGAPSLGSLPCSSILHGCITLSADGAQGEMDVLGPRSILILPTSFCPLGCCDGLITSTGSCGCASEGRMWSDAVSFSWSCTRGSPLTLEGAAEAYREERRCYECSLSQQNCSGVSL